MKWIVYVDMDGVLVDFRSGMRGLPEDVPREHADHHDDAPGIFALVEPMAGAIESYREHYGLSDTCILSHESPAAVQGRCRSHTRTGAACAQSHAQAAESLLGRTAESRLGDAPLRPESIVCRGFSPAGRAPPSLGPKMAVALV